MDAALPLPTLLSHVLAAFTIELDNEFEQRVLGGMAPAVLVGLPMWANYLRFVDAGGVRVGDLAAYARDSEAEIKSRLGGFERWGYVRVAPGAVEGRGKPHRREWIVRTTPQGERANSIWQPLPGEIEARWDERFGRALMTRLRDELDVIGSSRPDEQLWHLPIVSPATAMYARLETSVPQTERPADPAIPWFARLARVLLAFTLDFEREAPLSLTVSADVVARLGADAVPLRTLPSRTGVSKEAISMVLTVLERAGLAVTEPAADAPRGKQVRLTEQGVKARDSCARLRDDVEARWGSEFGSGAIDALRGTLEELVGNGEYASSPLAEGLRPYPDGWRANWRAETKAPERLPDHPMLLHRGAWVDGA